MRRFPRSNRSVRIRLTRPTIGPTVWRTFIWSNRLEWLLKGRLHDPTVGRPLDKNLSMLQSVCYSAPHLLKKIDADDENEVIFCVVHWLYWLIRGPHLHNSSNCRPDRPIGRADWSADRSHATGGPTGRLTRSADRSGRQLDRANASLLSTKIIILLFNP